MVREYKIAKMAEHCPLCRYYQSNQGIITQKNGLLEAEWCWDQKAILLYYGWEPTPRCFEKLEVKNEV